MSSAWSAFNPSESGQFRKIETREGENCLCGRIVGGIR